MTRARSIRRDVRRTLTCLLLGVVLTVGTAWGGAVLPVPMAMFRTWDTPPRRWPLAVCSEWPAIDTAASTGRSAAGRLTVYFSDEGDVPRRAVVAYSAGWPAECLRYWAMYDGGFSALGGVRLPRRWQPDDGPNRYGRLPLLPMWGGLAVDVTVWAGCAWVILFAPGAVRRAGRRARGRCAACGCDIAGLEACPECGAQR